MEKKFDEEVDRLEKEVKYQIIRLEEEAHGKAKSICRESVEKLNHLYTEAHDWLKEALTSEEMKERLSCLKQESARILAAARRSVQELMEREEVQSGKQKLSDAGNRIAKRISEGVEDAMHSDYAVKTLDTLSSATQALRNDERVNKHVKRLKKGTLKLAEQAFEGLKKVLDTEEEKQERDKDL